MKKCKSKKYETGGVLNDPPKKKAQSWNTNPLDINLLSSDTDIKTSSKTRLPESKTPSSVYTLTVSDGPRGNTGESKSKKEPKKWVNPDTLKEGKQSTFTKKLASKTAGTGVFGALTGLDAVLELPGQIEMMFKEPTVHNAIGTGLNALQILPYAKMAKVAAISKSEAPALKAFQSQFTPNPEAYYRIVGKDAADDFLESGLVRSRPKSVNTSGGIDLGKRPTEFPSFSKGSPSMEYAKGLGEHFLIETKRPMAVSTLGRHGKGTTQFPVDDSGKYLKEFPSNEAKLYISDGKGGYKPFSPNSNFENGGTLDSVLPMIPSMLGMVNPALGAASGAALGMYNNSKQKPVQNTSVVNSNPYGFELGGKLIGNEGAMQYSGASHSEGGIKVSPEGIPVQMSNQEVEDGEVVYTTKSGQKYIFSNKLKYNG